MVLYHWSQSTRLSREGALGPLSFIYERQYTEQFADNQQEQETINLRELKQSNTCCVGNSFIIDISSFECSFAALLLISAYIRSLCLLPCAASSDAGLSCAALKVSTEPGTDNAFQLLGFSFLCVLEQAEKTKGLFVILRIIAVTEKARYALF